MGNVDYKSHEAPRVGAAVSCKPAPAVLERGGGEAASVCRTEANFTVVPGVASDVINLNAGENVPRELTRKYPRQLVNGSVATIKPVFPLVWNKFCTQTAGILFFRGG